MDEWIYDGKMLVGLISFWGEVAFKKCVCFFVLSQGVLRKRFYVNMETVQKLQYFSYNIHVGYIIIYTMFIISTIFVYVRIFI